MGWKLVRDNQEHFCHKHGISGSWRTAPDPVKALTRKLFEEAAEWAEDFDPAELFDLRDVLNELFMVLGEKHEEELADAAIYHAGKVERNGQFRKHLEWNPNPNPNAPSG
jgi:predicted house-cleaning noncanonical NTP pyrophosphatase (MazG superfamily)